MPDYRRYRVAGGAYFLAVNLLERYPNDLLVRQVGLLRTVVRAVKERRPFHIDSCAILPDHLHCVWTLPPSDDDFTNRWRLIKQGFAKGLPMAERRSPVRVARGESQGHGLALLGAPRMQRAIWQRRFWQHVICDEQDYAAHIDY